MKDYLRFVIILILLDISSISMPVMSQSEVKVKINNILCNYEKEIFFESQQKEEAGGWMMMLPSGKEVTRSFLMDQADTIISYGTSAVPCLFKWVMNDELYIRYIAIYSLQQITGLSPFIATFDEQDTAGNREKAIQIWSEWYEKQKDQQIMPD